MVAGTVITAASLPHGTKLLRQSEKMPSVVAFVFAKFARAEPDSPQECQPAKQTIAMYEK
jgi:hypothetical protein